MGLFRSWKSKAQNLENDLFAARETIQRLRTEVGRLNRLAQPATSDLNKSIIPTPRAKVEVIEKEREELKVDIEGLKWRLDDIITAYNELEAQSAKITKEKKAETKKLEAATKEYEQEKRSWREDSRRNILEQQSMFVRHSKESKDREHSLVENFSQQLCRLEASEADRRRAIQQRLDATEALLSQSSNRVTELEKELQDNTEMITDTRLILNRSRNEIVIEKRKVQEAAKEMTDKNRKMEFLQQECVRMALR
ncbi:hypothetical protein VTL71DRAFT_2054 [Oculimacula yallundae]|uniref:Tropomyosin n=1 Tax=Oculimacula yallundae TaxID=86028 RepID=A0ABR4C7U0_9HELO